MVNIIQKNAVKNVLAASEPRRPKGDSTKYAPSYYLFRLDGNMGTW